MKLKNFYDFLNEEEKVKLDKGLREYHLTHLSDALFSVKSDDFQKEFSVKPYNSESLNVLPEIQEFLEKSIESLNVNDLYSAIAKAERVPYTYGGIFTSNFSLKVVPELSVKLDPELQRVMVSSEREFLMNNFEQLNREAKDLIIHELRDRAELLCVVIEALFYYVRTIDKDKFYQGMSSKEILEDYQKQVQESSKEASFSYEGPFSDKKTKAKADSQTETAYWLCEKDTLIFTIEATVSPSMLHSEDNIGTNPGLKFSISAEKVSNEKDFSFFDVRELTNRIKLFFKKYKKK